MEIMDGYRSNLFVVLVDYHCSHCSDDSLMLLNFHLREREVVVNDETLILVVTLFRLEMFANKDSNWYPEHCWTRNFQSLFRSMIRCFLEVTSEQPLIYRNRRVQDDMTNLLVG